MKTATTALTFILLATACSKIDSHTGSDTKQFSISASNVVAATVTLVAGRNVSNPTKVETLVEVIFSPDGASNFTEFVHSHLNQPVKILVDKYEYNSMFGGDFTNVLHGFDIHCASSNEAQIVANILNKK